jgi:hypothetical protein
MRVMTGGLHLSSGERKEGVMVQIYPLAGPWAVCDARLKGIPEALFNFEIISSFLFLISELLCSFFHFDSNLYQTSLYKLLKFRK